MRDRKLKPALLLGTGFHHYVLGEVEPYENFWPLVSWDGLIDLVAREAGLAIPYRNLSSIQRWEKLITTAITDGFTADGKHLQEQTTNSDDVELKLKKVLASKLSEINYTNKSNRRARYPLDSKWGSVISLNYDNAWIELDIKDIKTRSGLSEVESNRLFNHFIIKENTRLWFPNGSLFTANSIRVGLKDYGSKSQGIQQLVSKIKKVGQFNFEDKNPKPFELIVSRLINTLDKFQDNVVIEFNNTHAELPISWVTEAFFRPLAIAGCGLSDSETGLWHLLCERDRYFAMWPKELRPAIRILVAASSERADFWRTRPFGIEPVFCDNWDEGWQELMDKF